MKNRIRIFLWSTICFFLILMPVMSISVQAEELHSGIVLNTDTELAQRGKKLRVTMSFQDIPVEKIAAFRMELSYDTAYLTLNTIEPIGNLEQKNLRTNYTANGAVTVYASQNAAVLGKDGTCCTLVFDVNEDAPIGHGNLSVLVDQIVSSDLEKHAVMYQTAMQFPMEPLLSSNALLKKLKPSVGTLEPAFSPDITAYTMEVPYEVKSITFDMEAEDHGTVQVNRKNLNAVGQPTEYIITVISENGKEKSQYLVTATRMPKVEGAVYSPDAKLLALIPSVGRLVPDFSSEIVEYTLRVPYETETLSFDTKTEDGCTVSVNRKNLGKAGAVTEFVITVRSADGNARSAYVIQALRSEKSGVIKTQTSKKSASAKSSGKKSSNVKNNSTNEQTLRYNGAADIAASGNRIIIYQGDQFPAFLAGLLISVIILLALIAGLLFYRRKK